MFRLPHFPKFPKFGGLLGDETDMNETVDEMNDIVDEMNDVLGVDKPKRNDYNSSGGLIIDGKVPLWVSPWLDAATNIIARPISYRPTYRAAEVLAMLLVAGWVPPNAPESAFKDWLNQNNIPNESAEAEEGTENERTDKESTGSETNDSDIPDPSGEVSERTDEPEGDHPSSDSGTL